MNPYSREVVHALALSWQNLLVGFELYDAFTLSKAEVVLCFRKEEEMISLRILTQYRQLFIFTEPFAYMRKSNCQPVFTSLIGLELKEIKLGIDDRVFMMEFKGDQHLLFKWYGPLANIIGFKGNDQVNMFRPEIVSDKDIRLSQYQWSTIVEDPFPWWKVSSTQSTQPELLPIDPSSHDPNVMTIDEAYSQWSRGMHKWCRLSAVRQQNQTRLTQQIKRIEALVSQSSKAMLNRQSEADPKHVGDLIMAHLSQIKTGSKVAELEDWLSLQPISIRLDPKLSPVENAEKYYRKAKLREQEITDLLTRIETGTQELEQLRGQLQILNSATDLNAIERQKATESKPIKGSTVFHLFQFEGYEIRVGKSAATNDLLIAHHAAPSDLWLHARGVSGSHVIIRMSNKKTVPESVKLFAASLAAAYSKAKGSEWVPVSYTYRKFVRKPKGAKPGAVVIDREEVLMVQPYKR